MRSDRLWVAAEVEVEGDATSGVDFARAARSFDVANLAGALVTNDVGAMRTRFGDGKLAPGGVDKEIIARGERDGQDPVVDLGEEKNLLIC